MSLLTDPEYWLCDTCPPYEPKEAVAGEKASQDSQMRLSSVLEPTVILIESLVPCRLVGLTEICKELEETSIPLRKTRTTGLSFWAKGVLMLAYASAQLQDPSVWMLSS
jgi:hypothetical protein